VGGAGRDALTPKKPAGATASHAYPPDPMDETEVAPPTASPRRVKSVPGAQAIKRNTLEVLVFRALSTPLSFLLVVLQSHLLHASGRGTIVLAILTVTLFSRVLGDLGTAATNAIGEGDADVGEVTAQSLRVSLAFGIAASVVVVAVGRLASDIGLDLAIIAALALAPSIVTRTLSGILLGLARVRLWNYLQATPPVVQIAAFIVLVYQPLHLGLRGAIIAYTLGHAAAATIGIVATAPIWWRWLMTRRPRGSGRELLSLALAMGVANVVTLLSYRIELFILNQKVSKVEVGIYTNSVTVAESLWLVTTAFATAVWAPAIHESEERASALIVRSALKALLFITAAAGAVAVLVPFVVPRLFGDEFSDSVGPTLLLVPGIVLYGPVAILTIYLSVRKERAILAMTGPVVSLVLTALLAFLLIPHHGANGAAIASSIGYVVSALVVWGIFVYVAGLRWHGRSRVAAT
jgi:O-antigen/teichoic acid export membrane protein